MQLFKSLDRFLFQLLIAAFCTQWISLGTVAGLQVRLSYPILALLVVVMMSKGKRPTRSLASLVTSGVVPAAAIIVWAGIASNLLFDQPGLGLPMISRLVINCATALVVSSFLMYEQDERGRIQFPALALMCVAITTALLFRPLLSAGVNPASEIAAAIRSGDSDRIIFGVFRRAFIASSGDVDRANFRHGIALSLVLSMWLSIGTAPQPKARLARIAVILGTLSVILWTLLSFSRATWLVALLPAVAIASRTVVAPRVSAKATFLTLAVVTLIVSLFLLGVLESVANRILAPESYVGRITHYETTLENLNQGHRAFIGGPLTEGPGTHNIVFDLWVATGISGALGGLLLLGAASRIAGKAAWDLSTTGALNARAAIVFGLAAIPVVRMVTSGNATMQVAEWTALGAAVAASLPVNHISTDEHDVESDQLQRRVAVAIGRINSDEKILNDTTKDTTEHETNDSNEQPPQETPPEDLWANLDAVGIDLPLPTDAPLIESPSRVQGVGARVPLVIGGFLVLSLGAIWLGFPSNNDGISEIGTSDSSNEAADVSTASSPIEATLTSGPVFAADAEIQFVHGVPDTPVDLYLDGTALAPGFAPGTAIGPIDLAPGTYDVAVYAAIDDAPASAVDRSDESVVGASVIVGEEEEPATVVAHLDNDGSPALTVFADDLGPIPAGSGRIELRHTAAAEPVTVAVDGDILDDFLEPGAASTATLTAGSHQVEVKTLGGTTLLWTEITVSDGELATFALFGSGEDRMKAAVRRFAGVSSAPPAVQTGNSNDANGNLGLFLVGAVAIALAAAGAFVVSRQPSPGID